MILMTNNTACDKLVLLAKNKGEEIILQSCYLEERCRDDRNVLGNRYELIEKIGEGGMAYSIIKLEIISLVGLWL